MSNEQGRVDELAEAYSEGINDYVSLIIFAFFGYAVYAIVGETAFFIMIGLTVFGVGLYHWISFISQKRWIAIGFIVVGSIVLFGLFLSQPEIEWDALAGALTATLGLGPAFWRFFELVNAGDDEPIDWAKEAAGYKGYKDASNFFMGKK